MSAAPTDHDLTAAWLAEEAKGGRWVYFFEGRSADGIMLKIGVSKNVKARLSEIRRLNNDPSISCLGTVPGGEALERTLHDLFAAHRSSLGEWFSDHPEIRECASGGTLAVLLRHGVRRKPWRPRRVQLRLTPALASALEQARAVVDLRHPERAPASDAAVLEVALLDLARMTGDP